MSFSTLSRCNTVRPKTNRASLGFAALVVGGLLLPACGSPGENVDPQASAYGYPFAAVPVIEADVMTSTMQLSTTSGFRQGETFTGAVGLFAIDAAGGDLGSVASYGQAVSSIDLDMVFNGQCTDVLLVFAHDSGNGQGTLVSRESFQVKPLEDRVWPAVFPQLLEDASAAEPPADQEDLLKYLRSFLPEGIVITQPQVPGKPKLRPNGNGATGPLWTLSEFKLGGPCHGFDAGYAWADVFFVDAGQAPPSTAMREMTRIAVNSGPHPLLPYRHGVLNLSTDNPTATGDAYLVVVVQEVPVDGSPTSYRVHHSQRFSPQINAETEMDMTPQPTLIHTSPVDR